MAKPEHERAAEKAKDLFLSGYNCAESVLLSTLELMGGEAEWAPRVASGFGGGIGRTCQVCGAITGAVIAAGWARGRERAGEGLDDLYSTVSSLMDGFVERFGTTSCRMLIDVDLADPEQQAKAGKEGVFAEQCTKFVEFCTLMIAEKLDL